MLQIEGLKHEIKDLKREIINQLKYEMENIGFYSMDHNTKTIIDAMELQKKEIMGKIVSNTELIKIQVKQMYQ